MRTRDTPYIQGSPSISETTAADTRIDAAYDVSGYTVLASRIVSREKKSYAVASEQMAMHELHKLDKA